MIIIDGSEGEGGGQVVRNALALSLVTGESFRITNIRGRREKPGLMRQHLTAVEAACAIGNAECAGVAIGSSEIEFCPGQVIPGEYRFAVGTAGSTGLVLQTILMPLILAGGHSRLVLDGGTHNMMAPPFEFIEQSFLPVLNRLGPSIEAKLVRHGFYPRGGGRIEIDITAAPLRSIDCVDRGAVTGVSATALFAALPFAIADRELQTARKLLDWPVTGFGKLGVSAESLAKTAAHRMAGYIGSPAFAGPYLADQLLLPFALAGGGAFTTVKPSQHARTAADVIALFTGKRFSFAQQATGVHLVSMA